MLFLAGTLFLELWKRKNARLAYQWDVDEFEEQVSMPASLHAFVSQKTDRDVFCVFPHSW